VAASSASGGSRRPEPGVGTVAEEAARLLELLTGYTATAASGTSSSSSSSSWSSPRDGTAGRGSRSAEGHAGADHGSGPQDEAPPASAGGSAQCTCGGPAACRSCPLCQLIAFVQRVDPNAIDRLAEVVELAATGLRDLATVQRGRREQDRPEGPAGQ
jgi:hypothetical protein